MGAVLLPQCQLRKGIHFAVDLIVHEAFHDPARLRNAAAPAGDDDQLGPILEGARAVQESLGLPNDGDDLRACTHFLVERNPFLGNLIGDLAAGSPPHRLQGLH